MDGIRSRRVRVRQIVVEGSFLVAAEIRSCERFADSH